MILQSKRTRKHPHGVAGKTACGQADRRRFPGPRHQTASRRQETGTVRLLLSLLICCGSLTALNALRAGESTSPRLKAYYTRLPFDDHGFTGKYADIIVELPQRGLVIFSREFGYQPRWLPLGGKPHSVARLIARRGDGPDERPDNHNIACHAAIVAQTDAGVTVHWRYSPVIN